MPGRLDGRIALITGAAGGQGAAEAALFVSEGATVYLADIDDAAGVRTAADVGGTFLHLDVTSAEGWAAAAERIGEAEGRLDVLVNNAGSAPAAVGRCDTLDVSEYRRLFEVNVLGAVQGLQALLPLLEHGRGASVINVSSIDGLVGVAAMGAYTTSRFAMTGFTRTAAIDLGPLGIRVNSLHPGVIETPAVLTIAPDRLARVQRTVGRQPIPRMGRAGEVASLALFLASEESSYCTGGQFTVDGGHLAGPYREPTVPADVVAEVSA